MNDEHNINVITKYVIDTNVLLEQLNYLETEGMNFVILSHVMREIEQHCRYSNPNKALQLKGRQARRFIKANIDKFTVDLRDYIVDFSTDLDDQYVDNKILQACIENEYGIITKDVLLQIKATGFRITVIDPDDQGVYSTGYKGWRELDFTDDLEAQTDFYNDPASFGMITNEYVAVKSIDGKIKLHRFDGEKLVKLNLPAKKDEFIKPKNIQQMFALDMLLNDNIPIKIIIGVAGSGKTFLPVKVAIRDVVEGKLGRKRNKIMMVRNPIGSGKEIGFLKGTKEDKTQDFFKPIIQHLDGGEQQAQMLEISRQLEKEIPYYMKGLSIDSSFIIVDEAEDLTRKIIKLLGTRVAKDSVIVFCGDIEQAEDEFAHNNGLMSAVEFLKGNPLVGIVYLDDDIRSEASKVFIGL